MTHLAAGGETPLLRSGLEAVSVFAAVKAGGMASRDAFFSVHAETKDLVAKLIGAHPDDVAFTGSAAEAANHIVNGLAWQPGDNVVLDSAEYPTNLNAWLRLREQGLDVRTVDTTTGDDPVALFEQVTDENTLAICVSHVSYLTGRRFNLRRLRTVADRNGAMLIVDASHSLGVVPVEAALCDFLYSCCYKWVLGTHGVAICYWNRNRQPDFVPAAVGWHSSVREPDFRKRQSYTLWPDARRFELGNPPFISLYVLREGLRTVLSVGIEAIEKHVLALGQTLLDGLKTQKFDVVTPHEPEDRAGNIVYFCEAAEAVAAALAERDVLVWGNDGRVRFSIHLYNDRGDVNRALAKLQTINVGEALGGGS